MTSLRNFEGQDFRYLPDGGKLTVLKETLSDGSHGFTVRFTEPRGNLAGSSLAALDIDVATEKDAYSLIDAVLKYAR